MPQSVVNAPAHLQDRKIKDNLDYTVFSTRHYVHILLSKKSGEKSWALIFNRMNNNLVIMHIIVSKSKYEAAHYSFC